MLEELIKEMEKNIGGDDFETIEDECVEKIEQLGIGADAVEPLIKLIERHPLADFGMPGAIVHFVEEFDGYEDILYRSLKRSPSMHGVWMLNRICNDKSSPDKFRELLIEISRRNDIDKAIVNSAKEFVEYQSQNNR